MKDLKLEDYTIIKPYLDKANYEGYNSNFVTMMMWNHEYHIQYEIHDNFLVMLHNYKGTFFWAMPFTDEIHYQEAIDYMLEYSKSHNFDFMIDCAIEEFVDKIKPLYNDQLLFERTPYNDDYIYDRQMLQTLSGKKMQKRRNHYNNFLKEYPDFEYRDLDITNDFDIIIECLNRWEYEKEDLSESMTSEVRGVMYLLSSKNILDFEVGGIFIAGKMEAFAIASRLKHSTVQIHVEKANKDIRGLYPAILKSMLERHYSDVLYVNREEDMGLENLRKSKRALHPIKMINKYIITRKNIQILQANIQDLHDIKKLWQENFKDETDESTEFYFSKYYDKNNTFMLKNENRVISVIQIVPFPIMKQKAQVDSYFILGVCTQKTFEGQGYMKQLMHYVLDKYKNKSIYLQAYIPEIYNKFGFYASHYHQIIEIDNKALSTNHSIEEVGDTSLLNEYYLQYCKYFDEFRLRDDDYWKKFIDRSLIFNDKIRIFKDAGYIVYHEYEDKIVVSEFIYLSSDKILPMLSYIQCVDKNTIIECDLQVKIPGHTYSIITMMSNQVSEDTYNSQKYINEIY